jgi:hypothetical protein
MTAERRLFLVRSELEPEPGWVWVRASAAADIKEKYHDLEVAHEPPSWLTDANLESLRVVDIDDLDDELLLALRRGYQVYEAIDHLPLDEAWARDLPCRLCGHLVGEHAFDTLCPRVELPIDLAPSAATFPKVSYGAVKATVTLRDGSVVRDVFIAGGAVVKVGDYAVPPGGAFKPIPFASDEIATIEDGSKDNYPPASSQE